MAGCAQLHFTFNQIERAWTYREVCGVSRQLVLSLELFAGGGGREQAAAGPAGGQVLAGVFVFGGVGEG